MLNIDVNTHLVPQRAPTPQVRPAIVIPGRSVALQKLTPDNRGYLGATWVDGRSVLVPTVEMAAQVFEVSKPLIARHRRSPESSFASGLMACGWKWATKAERAAFVKSVEDDVWVALDDVVPAKVAP